MKISKHKTLLFTLISIIIFVLYMLPIYWMFISGLKASSEIYSIPPTLWPRSPLFNELYNVFKMAIPYLINSFIIAVSVNLVTLFIGATGGYALARLKVSWMKWILLAFLIAQMLPNILRVTPLFVIFRDLGLIDNYISVILAISTFTIPFAIIMLRAAFLEAPVELEEAALIDGASRFRAFFSISLPIVKPSMIIVSTITFIWSYGDFIFSISFLRNRAMQPATVGLYNFIGAEVIHWNRVMAFATLTALPLIILFLIFQKHIVEGLAAGAFD